MGQYDVDADVIRQLVRTDEMRKWAKRLPVVDRESLVQRAEAALTRFGSGSFADDVEVASALAASVPRAVGIGGWLSNEAHGYPASDAGNLPAHRRLRGRLFDIGGREHRFQSSVPEDGRCAHVADGIRALCERYAETSDEFVKFPLPAAVHEYARRNSIKSLRVPKEDLRKLVEHVARGARAFLEGVHELLSNPPRDAGAL